MVFRIKFEILKATFQGDTYIIPIILVQKALKIKIPYGAFSNELGYLDNFTLKQIFEKLKKILLILPF